ncbi:branched-chain amino acid ABC transporter permease [Paenarthrobacter aurescens]|uniref:branched-chain amino acid ABC transporter permease n=1 Tax=Paenarthrobacter aurescens TaxID=43663 RepID=UPI0021C02B6F|nr:branched-chain amino acid ABC transporter permease [Paenarthrobacter aurescens]MCT9868367.1 branched-chain amino acid ABC transporter permease [Paenarthrobacter aurescens]
MVEILLSILISAIVLGSLYSLLASGLSLIWSTLGVFNYAHGALLLLGAYTIWSLSERAGLPVALAFVIAVPVMAGLGALLEMIAVRPFINRPNGTLLVMVSTLAVASAVEGIAQLVWGPQNRQIQPLTSATLAVGDIQVAVTTLFAFGLTLTLVIGLIVILRKTQWGAAVRAVEQNRDMAMLVGIRPARIYASVFAIASVLACAAALVYATTTTITPAKGFEPLLTAFVVLVFGGSASLWGTLIGAFSIGLLDSATTYWLGLQWSPVAVFVLLVLVMLVRPQGLIRGRS